MGVEERFDICVEHPADLSHDCRGKRIESVVRRPFRSVAVRKPDEFSFPERLQHHPRRLRNDLVFQRRNTEWARLTITLWDENALHRLRVVTATMDSVFQIDQTLVETCAVIFPGYFVHSSGRVFAETSKRLFQ